MSSGRKRVDQLPRGRDRVVTVGLEEAVVTASQTMAEHHIGSLVVVDDRGRLAGIVSERDIMERVVAAGVSLSETTVKDIMTPNVASCDQDTSIDKARQIMTEGGIRHMPITEDGMAVGMISSREIMAHHQAEEQATREVTIFALAKLTESRDPETGSHLERVCRYSQEIAEELATDDTFSDRVDAEFIRLIYSTSPLHDVGKVSIPDHVLLKPGRLDDREFEIMKTHSEAGAETLNSALERHPEAEFLRMARDIAGCHHERFDGQGYPDRLAGENIPLSARIFAPADVYDALVSKRVYKEAFTHDVARSIIVEGAGTQFDADVVQAFLRCEKRLMTVRDEYDDRRAAA